MLTSIEGVFRNGKIELAETPADSLGEKRVIVTFMDPLLVDLRAEGISAAHAADLRNRMAPFADDWNSEEMLAYDDYDAAKAKL